MDPDKIMKRADELYVKAKLDKGLVNEYMAPEQLPHIVSDQVKAAVQAICEEMNNDER